jgi:hypothetical protein
MTSECQLEIACSLTPGHYAQRVREFRDLFATALRHVRREPTRLYLTFNPGAVREHDVRDLPRREQECCPFFSFSVDAAATMIRVDVAVPNGAEECLDDFERMATGALATRAERD